MSTSIEQALENCLETLNKPQQTIDVCAALYPGQEDELVELLTLAQATTGLRWISPQAQFVENAGQRLVTKLPDRNLSYHKRSRPIKRRRQVNLDFRKIFRAARYAIAVLLVLTVLSSGTALAADGAAPGDLLYGVDLAMEEIQLKLTTDPDAITRIHLKQAGERLREAEKKLGDRDLDNVNAALDSFSIEMAEVAVLFSGEDEAHQAMLSALIEEGLSRHQQVLDLLLTKVPEQAVPGIERAIEASSKAKNDTMKGPPEDHTTGKPDWVTKGKPEDKPKGKPDSLPAPKN